MIPPVLCVAGPGGSGKTHLLERLIRRLTGEGLRVAAIKHCQHIDRTSPGKDSDRLARAGACPAVAVADNGVEIRSACSGETIEGNSDSERRRPAGSALLDLVTVFCSDCHLVLAEGHSRSVYDKILLDGRDGPDGRRTFESVRLVVGGSKADGRGTQPGRDDTDAITQWVLSWLERRRAVREGLVAAVLTGGASRRMGADKSRLRIAGQSVLARLCELLADRIGTVMVVGQQPEWQNTPVCASWHPDIRGGLGPLGGIATALRVAAAGARAKAVCVLACDMPLVGGELLDHLLAGRDRAASATMLVNPGTGRIEPIAAIYEPHALGSIQQALDSGELSAADWLLAAGAQRLNVPHELTDQLTNANTPAEFEAIRLRMERSSS